MFAEHHFSHAASAFYVGLTLRTPGKAGVEQRVKVPVG